MVLYINILIESRCVLDIKDFLAKMNSVPHVSGHEGELAQVISAEFSKYAEVSIDKIGNLTALKRGSGGGPKIMICAHMDEIGMMVATIEEGGFVKFSPIGGIDKRNILAQEVTIHGREKVFGVIGIKPPHLTSPEDRKKAVDFHNMAIDTGYSKEKLVELIRPGDIITFAGDNFELKNNKLTGVALDDIAGVAAMHIALKNLEYYNHKSDVYFVASVREEVHQYGGGKVATYNIEPDIGIAIDVTFGRAPGHDEYETFELGKGPVLAIGPGHTRKLFEALKKVASSNKIPYQVECAPTSSGTDAYAIQVGKGGVVTGLISIPLKYMHSTVETLHLGDVEMCGKLVSDYVISLQSEGDEKC